MRTVPGTRHRTIQVAATACLWPRVHRLIGPPPSRNATARYKRLHRQPVLERDTPRRLPGAGLREESASDEFSSGQFSLECRSHTLRHKLADVSTQTDDFFHDPRTQISVFGFRHEENGLYTGIEFPIHKCHLKLEFKIGNGP